MPVSPKPSKKHWVTEKVSFARSRDFSKFYNARKWRKVSKYKRDVNPYCEKCESNGVVSLSNVADHIRGLGFLIDNGLDPYNLKELQSLCHKCHNKKSGKESHTSRGMGSKS
ncbi:HNH endonuclease [Patiriisocius marinus]|uniref:HNH endonuclease n=1 Tax=Patiriisocius marinus TaxID=1397112 RepID=UPI00232DEB4B|nr:HNH endonuclease [Patiriisocius marinus]